MKCRICKPFILFLLFGFTTQPLLAQVPISRDAKSPCPMQQQVDLHASQHSVCDDHVGKVCSDCDLCGHTSNGVISGPLFLDGLGNRSERADRFHSAFVSIFLSVESPPPRIF